MSSSQDQQVERMLLPHERWCVAVVLRRQRSHRTAAVARSEASLGPDGMALWTAGMATVLPGQLVACVGIALLALSRHAGSTSGPAYGLITLGAVLIVAGAVRYVQGARAGRAYRRLRVS